MCRAVRAYELKCLTMNQRADFKTTQLHTVLLYSSFNRKAGLFSFLFYFSSFLSVEY